MKALCWHGRKDVRIDTVPDPRIVEPTDAVVSVSKTAICGSDLHLYGGHIPTLAPGDILGHEFMGEVVEVGKQVKKLRKGDRVVVPFTIACGRCHFCTQAHYSLCDTSNPNAKLEEKAYGQATAGLFGFSHMLGGYSGGQAEYVRVPFADVGPLKLPSEVSDERALFLSDILPTGYQAAEQCAIGAQHIVAVWGAGPVGLFAALSAKLLGAARVMVVEREPERLALAKQIGAEIVDAAHGDVLQHLRELTHGRGPDACIDAVGLEAQGHGLAGLVDRAKFAVKLQSDVPSVLRECILACRKGGVVSIPGVYGGLIDGFPIGAAFGKALTLRMGQTHVQHYMPKLLERIVSGDIDTTFLITHRVALRDAPGAYDTFARKADGCVKVVMTP